VKHTVTRNGQIVGLFTTEEGALCWIQRQQLERDFPAHLQNRWRVEVVRYAVTRNSWDIIYPNGGKLSETYEEQTTDK